MADVTALVQSLVAYAQGLPWVALTVALVAICITTRLTTGREEGHQPNTQILDAKTPPEVPYWIPYIGHVPQMALNRESFLAGLRKRYPNGAFSLKLLGATHTFIYHPAYNTALASQPPHIIDRASPAKRLMQTNFGFPRSKASLALYDKMLPDLEQQNASLADEELLGPTVEVMTTRLRHNIADFVTFNSGDIDQAHWERLAEAGLVEDAPGGAPVVEADLFELVRNFVAFTASDAVFGTDFVENFPEFWQALWRFDAGFAALALDLPSLVPINSAIGARRARGVLFRCLDELEAALETHRTGGYPGPQWADLDNAGALLQRRLDGAYRRHGLTVPQRSALDLSLAWSLSAHAGPLVFWLLARICAADDGDGDGGLLARVRAEAAPFFRLEAPAVGFGGAVGIDTPSRIERVDLDGLVAGSPWLRAAYVETLRLDFGAWTYAAVREDTVVGDGEGKKKLLLRAGSYAHGAYELHHMDPLAYEDPEVWRPERHIEWKVDEKGEKVAVVDVDRIKPHGELLIESWWKGEQWHANLSQPGGGIFMCEGGQFAFKEILLFTAAIIAVYDIYPIAGREWRVPRQKSTAGTKHPTTETRVWIKSRPTAAAAASSS